VYGEITLRALNNENTSKSRSIFVFLVSDAKSATKHHPVFNNCYSDSQ